MKRSCLFTLLTFLVIPGSFVVVGNLSESKECMDLFKENGDRSELIQAAKESGDAEEASKLAADYRKWFNTTRKAEYKRLKCAERGEVAYDIQRMSIWLIFILGFWSSWLLSGKLVTRRKS